MAVAHLARQLVLTALPTLLIAAAADAAVGARMALADEAAFAALYAPPAPLSRLVLGSSVAQADVDPRRLGAGPDAFWNFGTLGAGPGYLRRWYALFRRHHPAPRRVVLVTPWFQFKPRTLWRVFEDDAEYLSPADLLDAFLAPGADRGRLLADRFPLMKYRREMLEGGLTREPAEAWRAGRGWVAFRSSLPELRTRAPEFTDPDDAGWIAATEGLLDDLARDGAAVALVSPPTYAPLTPDHAAQDRLLAGMAQARGMAWLDHAGGELARAPGHFWNWAHLNEAGARAFSDRLAADLARTWPEAPHAVQ